MPTILKRLLPLPIDMNATVFAEGLKKNPKLSVREADGVFRIDRKRILPGRGITRVLLPRVTVRARLTAGEVELAYGLDALAALIGVILIAGTIFELTLSRETYPRDYPTAFVFILAGLYLVGMTYDAWATDRLIWNKK